MAATSSKTEDQPAAVAGGLRKPVFVKVENLKPGTNGHTLVVRVLSSKTVLQRGKSVSPHLRNTNIAECLVGDETACILFTARNDQGIFTSGFMFRKMHSTFFSFWDNAIWKLLCPNMSEVCYMISSSFSFFLLPYWLKY